MSYWRVKNQNLVNISFVLKSYSLLFILIVFSVIFCMAWRMNSTLLHYIYVFFFNLVSSKMFRLKSVAWILHFSWAQGMKKSSCSAFMGCTFSLTLWQNIENLKLLFCFYCFFFKKSRQKKHYFAKWVERKWCLPV